MSQFNLPIYLVTIETVLLYKLGETIEWYQHYTSLLLIYLELLSSSFVTVYLALLYIVKPSLPEAVCDTVCHWHLNVINACNI